MYEDYEESPKPTVKELLLAAIAADDALTEIEHKVSEAEQAVRALEGDMRVAQDAADDTVDLFHSALQDAGVEAVIHEGAVYFVGYDGLVKRKI